MRISGNASVATFFATLLLVVLTPVCPAQDEPIDQALLQHAPQIIRFLRDKGCHNVGVLKFLVHKDGEPKPTDTAGTLNMDVARRLELALILTSENSAADPARQIGIIHDASAVAAKTPGANHTTPEGRQALFAASYPLAWGKKEVRPDALITGVGRVDKELKQFRISLYAYRPGAEAPEKLVAFTADSSPSALIEIGESFQLRGAFDKGEISLRPQEVVQAATRVKGKEEPYPLAREGAPVELEIRYDNHLIPIKFDNGKAFIPEPAQGQKVTLILKRTGNYQGRIGMVLKVNGENTLDRQRLRDVLCRKWILGPGDDPIPVEGFQEHGDRAAEFKVLSRAESKEREFYYGADVGTISLTVFREKQAKRPINPKDYLSDEAEDLAALNKGTYPPESPANLAALRAQLRQPGPTRGLIEGGRVVESKIQIVEFEPDPVPVLAATIVYYRR